MVADHNHKSSRGSKQSQKQKPTGTNKSGDRSKPRNIKKRTKRLNWLTIVLGIGGAVIAIALSWFFQETSPSSSSSSGDETRDNNSEESDSEQEPVVLVPPHVTEFLQSFVCGPQTDGGYCANDAVEPFGRTHRAKTFIASGTLLIKIPQSLQISDVDAVRALSSTSSSSSSTATSTPPPRFMHTMTGKPLDGGAYLALYLWQRFVHTPSRNEEDPLLPYYNVLPTDMSDHVILWEEAEFTQLLKQHSQVFAIAKAYRDMVQSEYNAFSKYYKDLTRKDYVLMRLLVLTRSFGRGPPTVATRTTEEELQTFNSTLGVDFTLGSRAMVPILDMYDHHATPNVAWRYNDADGSFVVTAAHNIEAGQVLYDSYGTYTDAHLLSKFGFVATDGSSHTEASMTAFHRLLNVGLRQQFDYVSSSPQKYKKLVYNQRFLLARYLQFDDGHEQCIVSKESKEYRLKQLKLQHLMRCAHDPKRWILTVPPRNPNAKPPRRSPSSAVTTTAAATPLPSFDANKSPPHVDATKVLATCRLMVLTVDDYAGQAIQVLESHLANNTDTTSAIWVEAQPQSDLLEYHALICLARWTGLLARQFDDDVKKHPTFATTSDSHQQRRQRHRYAAFHALLGEVQTLELMTQLASAGARQHANNVIAASDNNNNNNNIAAAAAAAGPKTRRLPCEWNYTKELAEETRFV